MTMTEEQAFRDALRRADSVEIPVPPIVPSELTGPTSGRVPWRGILAVAAALVVVAGVGVGFWLNGRGILATPAASPEPAGAIVEVDIFSGRENPVVDLPESTTDQLYALLAARADDLPHPHPNTSLGSQLGFRGLVVTPAGSENRSRLRLVSGLVYVGSDDDHQLADDVDNLMYQLVMDAIRDSLPEEVVTAIDKADVPPAVRATVTVDLSSGEGNPVVEVDPSLLEELHALLDPLSEVGQDALAWALPEGSLGFRGFRVDPEPGGERPPLLVLPGMVQVDPDGDGARVYADPQGTLFQLVAELALSDELRDEVAAGSVQVRVKNIGDRRLSDVVTSLPSWEQLSVGSLGTGEAGGYRIVLRAYSYTYVIATERGEKREYQPIDYVGETPLSPGRYTYEIQVVEGEGGPRLELQLSQDSAGGWPEPPATHPAVGVPALWRLIDPDRLGPDSTELTIAVSRFECNGGVTGEVLEPVVDYGTTELVIRAEAARIDDDRPRTCPENDWVEVVVKLAEPIGNRALIDAACLQSGAAVNTSVCADGPVRWSP